MKNNNSNNLKRISYYLVITFINVNIYLIISLGCYGYAYTSTIKTEDEIQISEEDFLTWIDSPEIEKNNRIKLLNFLKDIKTNADKNKANLVIHNLAGNSYYTTSEIEDERYDYNSNRLSFLDTMPSNTAIKIKILLDLNKIANLAKIGNTKRIVTLLDMVLGKYDFKEEEYINLPEEFPLDRKDSLIRFFKRMDNDITRNSLHYLFDVYEAINNNNLVRANSSLERLITGSAVLYDIESSILNLEDFGAGYRSFSIWSNELNKLLGTFNLKDNKPRINELLSYVKEANVSYFKPKTNMLIGSFFYSSRTENEIDGALLCNGQHIDINRYPYFVKTYLKTNKVASITIEEWNKRKQKDNNVGLFGYDKDKDYFIVPYVCPGTYLSPVLQDYKIDSMKITQGMFKKDQLVQLQGEVNWNGGGQGHTEIWTANGVFKPTSNTHTTFSESSEKSTHPRGFYFDLAASKQVNVGDRIMPRTVFENLYVIVSEEWSPKLGQQP